MARSFYEALTTPPPRKPPPPKYPLFTKDPFSTTSFSPGHLVGAGVLVLGVVGLAKLFISRGQAEAARVRQASAATPRSPVPQREPTLAQVENQRGQYGAPGGRP
jgi:hypothetical protein